MDGYSRLNANIYLNPHSPRYEQAKASGFLARHGARDPLDEEAKGLAYIPDSDVNIKNPEDVMNHLRAKYNKKMLQQFDLMAPEIAVQVSGL